jgi:hypothetical protein
VLDARGCRLRAVLVRDHAPELKLIHDWLDLWSGLGLIVAGGNLEERLAIGSAYEVAPVIAVLRPEVQQSRVVGVRDHPRTHETPDTRAIGRTVCAFHVSHLTVEVVRAEPDHVDVLPKVLHPLGEELVEIKVATDLLRARAPAGVAAVA